MLLNKAGQRFVQAHRLGRNWHRDVVTRAIAQQIEADGLPYVHLDISHLPAARLKPVSQYPGQLPAFWHRYPPPPDSGGASGTHYAMGGVKVDDRGKSEVANLLAVGRWSTAACMGPIGPAIVPAGMCGLGPAGGPGYCFGPIAAQPALTVTGPST
ncbi:MAG: FAD-binding protein [Vampirovibrionales bacterium]